MYSLHSNIKSCANEAVPRNSSLSHPLVKTILWDWKCGSSGRTHALRLQSPEFKPSPIKETQEIPNHLVAVSMVCPF